MPNGRADRWTTVLSLLVSLGLIVVVVVVFFIEWRFPPPTTIRALPERSEIVITDECLATWIAVNNTFGKQPPWDPKDSYWSGVLIQLGKYKPWNDAQPASLLGKVCITRTGVEEDTCYKAAEFKDNEMWINIIARGEEGPDDDPMTVSELDVLFPVDGQGDVLSFHKYFDPYRGGITFWANRFRGYRLDAEPDARHNRLTFSWVKEPNQKVEVWRNRERIQEWSDVERITVKPLGEPEHGNQSNPPQKP